MPSLKIRITFNMGSKLISTFPFFFLFSVNLFAESYRMNANYYVRSSDDFNESDDNRVGILSKGSTFTVLEKKRLGRAEGLKIRVTSLSPTSYLKQSKEYWIYKPNNTDFMKTSISVPVEAQSIEVPCDSCLAPAQQSAEGVSKNTNDLGDISRTILTQQNQATGKVEQVSPQVSAEKQIPGSLDEKIKKYSESTGAKIAIEHALKYRFSSSHGSCYRSVKKALKTSNKTTPGLIPYHYSDLAALNAKQSLKKFGFINLLDIEPYKTQMVSPSRAPKGAVLVYSSGIPCGTATDCGHIEIKTNDAGKPGYVSDYYSNDPINETGGARKYGTKYKLVGVMIKP